MAQVGSQKVEGSEKKRQVVLLPDGMYSGLLAGYSLPKAYKAFKQGDPEEWKMFVWFVLTHDRTNTQLKQFSSALMTVRCVVPDGMDVGVPKLFYNAESGLISAYAAFIYAMRGGKLSKQEIVDDPEDYDLDDFIGFPAMLFIKQGKANKDGLITQKVKEIQPADKGVQQAVKALFDGKKIGFTEETHLAILESPSPVYEGDEETVDYGDMGEEEEGVIPF